MLAVGHAPAGGSLYSLIHLGGFAGDLAHYRKHCTDARRVLELGCGDGRVAAALCLGEAPLSILQQQLQQEDEEVVVAVVDKEAVEVEQLPPPSPPVPSTSPRPTSQALEYLGIELCAELAAKAALRLAASPSAQILNADFHDKLKGHEPFDAVVVSANTLFCTPRHANVLTRCAEAVGPSGLLLLDVYNALPFHEDACEEQVCGEKEFQDSQDGGAGIDDEDLLVVVEDEEGREWSVYEQEPVVGVEAKQITCTYDFRSADGEVFTQSVEHHYVLPEDLVRLVSDAGFEIQAISGDFLGTTFDPEESEHVVLTARLAA